MKALAIHADNTYHGIDSLDYEDISNTVGGYMQMLPFNCVGKDLTMYVNEEGIRMGLPMNRIATTLVGPENLHPGDYVKGSMYVTGPVDEEGNETPLDSSTFAFLCAWLAFVGGRDVSE